MSRNVYKKVMIKLMLLLTIFVLMAGTSNAGWVFLKAGEFTKFMPDGTPVKMWGFSSCTMPFENCGVPEAPGPVLDIAEGDPEMKILLMNELNVPVSIVIPGQITSMSPVTFTDSTGRERVRSFTHETAPQKIGLYEWNALRPGSYIYHSGTHPAVQVQMGLYGPLKMDFNSVNNIAYPGTIYENEDILFFSEIDPALHAAVEDGSYGTAAMPSTVNYDPKYFLINGEAYSEAAPLAVTSDLNNSTLIRFYNAGLKTHIPIIHDLYMSVIAEDGNVYPYPREQYSINLPALKTKDAMIAPSGYLNILRMDYNPIRKMISMQAESGARSLADIKVTAIQNKPVTPRKLTWDSGLVSGRDDLWNGIITRVDRYPGTVTVSGLAASYPVHDRRLFLTNSSDSPGGMLTYLEMARPPFPAPVSISLDPPDVLSLAETGDFLPLDDTPPKLKAAAGRIISNYRPPVKDTPDNITNTGPVTLNVSADLSLTGDDFRVNLSAEAETKKDSYITAAEWWIGEDPGEGNGGPMRALDGNFNSTEEAVTVDIRFSTNIPTGIYRIKVRSRDSEGNWGDESSTRVSLNFVHPPEIVKPATVTVSEAPEIKITATIDKEGISENNKKDASGSEKPTAGRTVLPDTIKPVTTSIFSDKNPVNGDSSFILVVMADDSLTGGSDITAIEWYMGKTDPGVGKGELMIPMDGLFDSPVEVATANITIDQGTAEGDHTFNARSRDEGGHWSEIKSIVITVRQPL